MTARRIVLKLIYLALALLIAPISFAWMCLLMLLVAGEVSMLDVAVVTGGMFALGKAICNSMSNLESEINRLDRAIERNAERGRKSSYELGVMLNLCIRVEILSNEAKLEAEQKRQVTQALPCNADRYRVAERGKDVL